MVHSKETLGRGGEGTEKLSSWIRVLLENLIVVQLVRKFPDFMESEVLLLRSQQPTTGPYPKPEESSPNLTTQFP
jgi:hypothetical protein